MLQFLNEPLTAWERIAQTKKTGQPLVIYGTGNAADKIIDFCEKNTVPVSGIFASDGFVRGQSFRGHKVQSYEEITEKIGTNFLLIIAFASELPNLLNKFQELSQKHETIVPHLGLYNNDVVTRNWLIAHQQELTAAYNLLAEDLSRQVFKAMLNYKFSGKIEYLFQNVTLRTNDLKMLKLTPNETYFDLGAYNGDTVQEFLQITNNAYQNILAMEADPKTFKKLALWQNNLPNFYPVHAAAWKEQGELAFGVTGGRQASIYGNKKQIIPTDTVDHLSEQYGLHPTYMKLDVEGAEMEALEGAQNCLRLYHPKLLLAAYHFDGDLFRIPLYLHQLNSNYRFYLRKHPYVPAWEINYFCL